MAQEQPLNTEEVVLGKEIGNARVITLNRPRQLNVISSRVVYLLAQYLEQWDKDEAADLIIVKGAGRAFSAGGDLKMFYEGRGDAACVEVVYRMYWLCYHIHSYKKTMVALVHGLVMGGGGAVVVPLKFSVVSDKTIFATPETGIGHHVDCSFSYILPRLPGYLGEYLALTGARLNGKEMVAVGLATHYVPSEKLDELEQRLLRAQTGDERAVRAVIEEYSLIIEPDKESVLNKLDTINKCFSGESVEEIFKFLETEGKIEGNEWLGPVLKGLKRISPTALKITLRSIREGRKQDLAQSLKKEFRLTINIIRSLISNDIYEGIRAITIEKDNAPKWNPASLEEVKQEDVDCVFETFDEELELRVPDGDKYLWWEGRYETTPYAVRPKDEAE